MTVLDPWDAARRVDALCAALPEVSVREDGWARLCNIGRDTFCFLTLRRLAGGSSVPVVVLRAAPEEQAALLAAGHPYSASRGGYDRVEVLLDEHTDWQELAELLVESYRRMAPKHLGAKVGS